MIFPLALFFVALVLMLYGASLQRQNFTAEKSGRSDIRVGVDLNARPTTSGGQHEHTCGWPAAK